MGMSHGCAYSVVANTSTLTSPRVKTTPLKYPLCNLVMVAVMSKGQGSAQATKHTENFNVKNTIMYMYV